MACRSRRFRKPTIAPWRRVSASVRSRRPYGDIGRLARGLGRQRPQRGRAVLMFQPAEEDGSGAAAVIGDPRFRDLAPDFAFSYHNMPGLAFG